MSNASETSNDAIETFISRWKDAEAAERANYQMFLAELCELLAVAPPDPSGADNAFNQYVFDRAITRSKPDGSQTTVWADLYKRSCFILETKQGANAAANSLTEDPASYSSSAIRPPRQRREKPAPIPPPPLAALAAHIGKRSKKRVQEIDPILETLRNLGQL